MSVTQFLFSPRGRINRKPYILSCSLFSLLAAIISIFFFSEPVQKSHSLVQIAFIVLLLVCLVTSFISAIKRSHDRGRTGFFILLFFIPLINFWPTTELLVFKGTKGPNKYGEDPLNIP
jgi:uncharacterized membrane protein YhaH (DUF805 family)